MNAITRLQALLTEQPALAEPLKTLTDPAAAAERLAAIAAKNGIAITAAELRTHLEGVLSAAKASGDISDAQLDTVAGGARQDAVLFSILSFGIGCAVASAANNVRKRNCGEELDKMTMPKLN